jgi:single-stranded DNA-specific DHH superfamily exonuclease
MGLTDGQLKRLRELLHSAVRPLILFDDDPDGLSSFLLIYKHVRDGKGMPVKNAKAIGSEMALKVNEYDPDLVVILDVPMMSRDFIEAVRAKVVWVDHHPVQESYGAEYFNPRTNDDSDNRPTAYWVYRALEENLWIAMIGIIGDWFLPEQEIRIKFSEEYPGLLPDDINKPEVALHNSKLGELCRIFSFNLKGRVAEVIKSVKVLTRISSPLEILDQTSAGGRFIFKKYSNLLVEYEALLKKISVRPDDKLLLFVYSSENGSFSAELSNELIYKHPDKVILVAWEYNGEYKCSLRSTKANLPNLIEKSLGGISGYGGGHDHAAGACVKTEDFRQFVENFRKNI